MPATRASPMHDRKDTPNGDAEPLQERLRRIAELSPPRPRYTLLGEIAEGGMGRILRVWDEALQRELAMKVVSVDVREGSSAEERRSHTRRLERFIEEARITGQLDHPGIVPVHEIAVDTEGHLYFTMPLVQGSTLKEVFALAREERDGWTLHRVLDVLHKVCQTVAFAHTRDVIHRDLKPDNIMVGRFGEVYVMDWGLALVEQDPARGPRSVVGTPAYMAPEQVLAPWEVGPRSDVYSLGAILYELLGDQVPHQRTIDEATPGATSVPRLVRTPPRPIHAVAPDAPAELLAICRKAMATDPEERYATAHGLARDLSAWLEGRVVHAHRTDRFTKVRKWRARNRSLSHALEALVLLLLTSATVVALLARSQLRTVRASNVEIEARSYAANLHATGLHLRAIELTDALRRLEACPPALRGWEWGHLERSTDGSLRVLRGHDGPLHDVAVRAGGPATAGDPDDALIATASDDATVRLWNTRGAELFVLAGHTGPVNVVSFQPGSRVLASASDDRSVRLWDTDTGRPLGVASVHDTRVLAIAHSRDGRLRAAGDADGRTLVFETETGEERARLDGAPENSVLSLAFTPDGEHLFVGHTFGGTLVRWSLAEVRPVAEASLGDAQARSLVLAPDGETLFVASGGDVLALDARTLEERRRWHGHEAQIASIALHGRRLLTASADNTIASWDPTTGRRDQRHVGHVATVRAVAFLPGGDFVSAAEDDTARVWSPDTAPARTLEAHQEWVTAIAFLRGGASIASSGRDRTVRTWDVATGVEQERLVLDASSYHLYVGLGDTLITSGADAAVRAQAADGRVLWRAESGEQHPLQAVAVGDERAVATTTSNRLLGWRHGSREPDYSHHVGECYALAFHPDGDRFALGTQTGELELRDAATGLLQETLRVGSPVNTIAFARTRPLMAAGTRDRSVLVWSTETGERVASLLGHENQITSIAFSPDDRRLVSGSLDGTVRVWDVDRGEALLTLRDHEGGVTAVAFSPRGDVLASSSKDGTLRLYHSSVPAKRRAGD